MPQLCDWAKRNYRDKLGASDFADSALLTESYQALDELTQLLNPRLSVRLSIIRLIPQPTRRLIKIASQGSLFLFALC
ncbi:N-succinylarginine dihydrolase (plasmid) [Pseudoalteromonas espejiana]